MLIMAKKKENFEEYNTNKNNWHDAVIRWVGTFVKKIASTLLFQSYHFK